MYWNAGSPASNRPLPFVSSHSTSVVLAPKPVPVIATVSPLSKGVVAGGTGVTIIVCADALGVERNAEAVKRNTRPALHNTLRTRLCARVDRVLIFFGRIGSDTSAAAFPVGWVMVAFPMRLQVFFPELQDRDRISGGPKNGSSRETYRVARQRAECPEVKPQRSFLSR
jgi:hypothetical protein